MFELLKINHLNIHYAPAPLTPETPISILSAEEYKEKFDSEYTETLYSREELYLPQLTRYESDEQPRQAIIENRIKNPLDGLVICQMVDPVGHGLFTRKAIPKDTLICFFSGVMQDSTSEFNEHTITLDSNPDLAADLSSLPSISTKNYGGLARFMQHLPEDKKDQTPDIDAALILAFSFQIDLAQAKRMLGMSDLSKNEPSINSKSFDQIAFANVNIVRVTYKNVLLLAAIANRDIAAYSQIGFDYGKFFAEQIKGKPLYFNHQSKIVVSADFYRLNEEESQAFEQAKITYVSGVHDYKSKKFSDAEIKVLHAQSVFVRTKSYYCFENATAFSTLASIYRDEKQIALAIENMAKAFVILETVNEPTQACLAKLNGCLDLLDEVPLSLKILATHYLRQEKYFLAIALFTKFVIKLPPHDADRPSCAYNAATCFYRLGNHEFAAKWDKEAKDMTNCSAALLAKIERRSKSSTSTYTFTK